MSIGRGEDWGEVGPLPAGGVVVSSDLQARRVVTEARQRRVEPPPLGLVGGDLCRTLGGRGDEARLRTPDAARLRVDVGSVLLDGRRHWFVAHLVARRSWWRGRLFVAMNAEWCGSWSLGPRAHPSDGLLDISDGNPTFSDRLRARRRLSSGDHLPHPAIEVHRTGAFQTEFAPPLRVRLDGEYIGPVRNLSVRVEPAALNVVI